MSIYSKIIHCFILLCFLVNHQTQAQTDSLVLSYEDYMANIVLYHPVAQQANLKEQLAEAEWLAAKGNFDPVLSASFNEKNFADKLYYQHFSSKLKVPTRLGVDVVAGYENTEGYFLNPENKTDDYGLWNIGLEANLLQGLLIDERRTALRQAKIYQQIARNQQQLLLNDLFYAASIAYLNWQKNYYAQIVLEESRTIAATYFDNTKQSFFGGEKTAMDTLEAFISYRDATNKWEANRGKLTKAQQQLENFLWFKGTPLALQNGTIPADNTIPILEVQLVVNVDDALRTHPVLAEKSNKQAYFEAEQRLKREKLKPKLKVKYNPLLATSENSLAPNYSMSDYKWGVDFKMPLYLRSERAGIQKGEIKLTDIALDIANKRNELRNKIENSTQQQAILQRQLALQEQNVSGYRLLLEGENQKFLYGESSVFLLNKRQEKYIDGQLKLLELYWKWQVERLDYAFYTNSLL